VTISESAVASPLAQVQKPVTVLNIMCTLKAPALLIRLGFILEVLKVATRLLLPAGTVMPATYLPETMPTTWLAVGVAVRSAIRDYQ